MIANLMISGKEDEVFFEISCATPQTSKHSSSHLWRAERVCDPEQKGSVPPSKKVSVPL